MVALFGLPGASSFDYRRVSTRAEGVAWIEAHYREDESQETLSAFRHSRVVSNREAALMRWPSGHRIIGPAVDEIPRQYTLEERGGAGRQWNCEAPHDVLALGAAQVIAEREACEVSVWRVGPCAATREAIDRATVLVGRVTP